LAQQPTQGFWQGIEFTSTRIEAATYLSPLPY
jgi:hypothetical protein